MGIVFGAAYLGLGDLDLGGAYLDLGGAYLGQRIWNLRFERYVIYLFIYMFSVI